LATNAAANAHKAIEYYVSQDYPEFFLRGGIALEQAMKARLARENAAFLAPQEKFPAARHPWRAREDVSKVPTRTATVTAKVTLERVVVLEPSFSAHESGMREILRYRNGEAHFGTVDSSMHRRLVVNFLRATNALLCVDPSVFWRPHEVLLRTIIDEQAAEVDRELRPSTVTSNWKSNAHKAFGTIGHMAATPAPMPRSGFLRFRYGTFKPSSRHSRWMRLSFTTQPSRRAGLAARRHPTGDDESRTLAATPAAAAPPPPALAGRVAGWSDAGQ
jgi:hypothetical protein